MLSCLRQQLVRPRATPCSVPLARFFHASSTAAATATTASAQQQQQQQQQEATAASPIVELRQYHLHPEHAAAFLKATNEAADLRKSLVPLRFFSVAETGTRLNTVTHAYYYANGLPERDATRAAQGQHPDWQAYVANCQSHVAAQYSDIFVEASFLDGVAGLAQLPEQTATTTSSSSSNKTFPDDNSSAILELRHYQLQLGYDTVPKFLELYKQGLPSKLQAPGTHPTTSLVTVLYSDVGRLNQVYEIWYHGAGTVAMETSRQAARQALPWRQAIAQIALLAQEFTTSIHKPTVFSPLR